MLILTCFKILAAILISNSYASDWIKSASILNEETDIKAKEIKRLSEIPDIENEVINAINTKNEVLALRVIRELSLFSAWRKVFYKLNNSSPKDIQAYLIVTANTIYSPEDSQKLEILYLSLLTNKVVRPGTKIAILDGLRRLKSIPSEDKLLKVLQDDSFEVRMELLTFLRATHINREYPELIKLSLKTKPYQLRQLAVETVLNSKVLRKELKASLVEFCAHEARTEIKKTCTSEGFL